MEITKKKSILILPYKIIMNEILMLVQPRLHARALGVIVEEGRERGSTPRPAHRQLSTNGHGSWHGTRVASAAV